MSNCDHVDLDGRHSPAPKIIRQGNEEFNVVLDVMRTIGNLAEVKCSVCQAHKPAVVFPKVWRYSGAVPICQICTDIQNRERRQKASLEARPWHNPIVMRRRADELLRGVRNRKKRWDVDLTTEWILDRLYAGGCEFTGLRFDFETKRGAFTPSIDRIDVSKGYLRSNCRMVILGYNYARNHFDDADVLTIARAIVMAEGDR